LIEAEWSEVKALPRLNAFDLQPSTGQHRTSGAESTVAIENEDRECI
jgi:hypothetical protein